MESAILNGADILKIREVEARLLYSSRTQDDLRREYRELCKVWHPDHNKEADAAKVFGHITALYERLDKELAAEANPAAAAKELYETLEISGKDGKKYSIRYYRSHKTDTGEMYVGAQMVTYFYDKSSADICKAAVKNIKALRYADDKMREQCERYMPKLKSQVETADGTYLIIEKTPDLLSLRDVLDYSGGKIDIKHVAWIISSLLNIACYLEWAKVSHNAISLDNYFISPKFHSGALLGGWGFAVKVGAPLTVLPARTDAVIGGGDDPASPRIDQMLIKAIGRELLGDPQGAKLPYDKSVPKPFSDWLCGATNSESPRERYKHYREKVLKASFGPPKFIIWALTALQVYLTLTTGAKHGHR